MNTFFLSLPSFYWIQAALYKLKQIYNEKKLLMMELKYVIPNMEKRREMFLPNEDGTVTTEGKERTFNNNLFSLLNFLDF